MLKPAVPSALVPFVDAIWATGHWITLPCPQGLRRRSVDYGYLRLWGRNHVDLMWLLLLWLLLWHVHRLLFCLWLHVHRLLLLL